MAAQADAGRTPGIRSLRDAIVGLFILTFWLPLSAQLREAEDQPPKTAPATELILSSYEGQNVTSIELAGRPALDVGQFAPLFAQHAGEPFSRLKVEQTIAAIKASGHFSQVQLQIVPEPNGVQVLLVLKPAVYFGLFEFPGAKRFAYSRLLQAANYPPEAPFNAADVQRDQESLLSFFRQEGYFQAAVHPEVRTDDAQGIANIFFEAALSRRAKFGEVEIAGVAPQEGGGLAKQLRGPVARLRGAAIRPGKNYRRASVTNATQYLQSKLENQGRLAAQVKLQGAEYHAATNRADIHYEVSAGPLVHVRVDGAHLWSWKRKSLLPIYQGVGVDPELVEEGNRALASYFQAKGYLNASVDSHFATENGSETILYRITKGKKHKVTQVALAGNQRLPDSQLLPHVTVRDSRFFSPGRYSQQLVQASAANLSAVYRSEGFSSVQVTPKITKDGEDIRVLFQIDEGAQDIVKSLRIEGAQTLAQAQFAPQGLKLSSGRPYSEKLIQADRASIVANYLKSGYLTASFRETATADSKNDPHSINVVYHIAEGPRVDTRSVITLGREHTQPRLIEQDVASIQPGSPLTETELLTGESKLYDHTGVFDWAEVGPKRQITTQSQEDVLVKVHEAERNQITYGLGFELINRGGSVPSGTVALPNLPPIGLPSSFTTSEKTFYGPRGTFQYTRNNVRGNGSSLSLTGFAGRLDQRGAAYYIDPTFLWSRWKSTTSISVERNEENPIFSSQVELASYQLQRSLRQAKSNTFFLQYSLSQTDLTRIEIPALVLPRDRDVRLSTVAVNFTRDTRDNPLDEHKGVLESAEFDINSTKLGASVDFAKLTTQSAFYKQVFHKAVWANSIRIGLAEPFAGSPVPLSQEFFTGGGNTLRGFPLDGAGPQREVPVCSTGSSTDCTLIQVPTGGNELLLLNTEIRIPLPLKKGLSLVTFYDGGNVFPDVGFHDFASLYSNNVGLGLRYATPVGPVRFDLGRNLNPIPGINAPQYFFTIGQAF